MSLPASLYLHEVEIFSWYHEIDPTFLILFTKDEVCHEVADEDGENNYIDGYYLQASAATLRDRLEVLGIGRTMLREAFNTLAKAKCDDIREHWDFNAHTYREVLPDGEHVMLANLSIEQDMKSDFELLKSITVEDWAKLFVQALKSPKEDEERSLRIDTSSFESLMKVWGEEPDPRVVLSAALLACEPVGLDYWIWP